MSIPAHSALGAGQSLTLATCIGVVMAMTMGATRMGIISYLVRAFQDMALPAIPAAGFAMVFNVSAARAALVSALLGAIDAVRVW